MKLIEIYDFLDNLSPFSTQAKWDNSGLLVGNFNDDINKIYLSLDVDLDLIEKAEENSLFIVHHPIIFKPLKNLANMSYPNNILNKMIKKNISLISMHTNYDLSHLNKYFVEKVLKFNISYQDEYLIYVDLNIKLYDLINHIKKCLNINVLKISYGGNNSISKIAICTGSGGDLIQNVNADCFLSGDFKYHQALEAISNNLTLIDIAHYESEICFSNSLYEHLQILPLKVIITASKNPFEYF